MRLAEAQRTVAGGDAYAIAKASTAFHEAVIETAANELMIRMMRPMSGRITWLFFLTSGLPADEASTITSCFATRSPRATSGSPKSVAYAHIERDRHRSFDAMRDRMDG